MWDSKEQMPGMLPLWGKNHPSACRQGLAVPPLRSREHLALLPAVGSPGDSALQQSGTEVVSIFGVEKVPRTPRAVMFLDLRERITTKVSL